MNTASILPPMPPIPVKLFKVYVTEDGPGTNLVEAPSQVEVWNRDYSLPTGLFAEWGHRFKLGNKLVFEVGFEGAGVYQQHTKVKWESDVDVNPPVYRISISQAMPYQKVDNGGTYILQLLSQEGYGREIDWSFSVNYNDYHAEYALHGVGWDYITVDDTQKAWIPHLLPAGNWTVIAGPIRAVAYRVSDRVEDPPSNRINATGPFHHESVILIPYKTKYWTVSMNVKWRQWQDHAYMSSVGIISGSQSDLNKPSRVQSWAYYDGSNVTRSGSYNVSTTLMTSSYNSWAAQYRTGFGAATFLPTSTVNSMKSLFPNLSAI